MSTITIIAFITLIITAAQAGTLCQVDGPNCYSIDNPGCLKALNGSFCLYQDGDFFSWHFAPDDYTAAHVGSMWTYLNDTHWITNTWFFSPYAPDKYNGGENFYYTDK